MSRLEYPWHAHGGPYPLTKSSTAPRMVSSAPDRAHSYYSPTFQYSRKSQFTRNGTTTWQIMSKQDQSMYGATMSKEQKGACPSLWTSLKELFPGTDDRKAKKRNAPYDRWKACGYLPCPILNHVPVRNSTPRLPSITISQDYPRSSLRSTSYSQRPTNWPGHVQQPASRPLLSEWPGVQKPLTRNAQLDPYLQHRCNSPHPITFDIALGPNKIVHNTRDSPTLPLDPAHFSRLATCPPVMYMRIESVSDDPLPHFPWQIEVKNPRGITCGDIFHTISRRFQEYVSEDEYNRWTALRKKKAARAYYARVRSHPSRRPGEVTGPNDGLRRIDYIGGKVVFRGLEQASAMVDSTWLMYLGSEGSIGSCFRTDLMSKV